MNFFQRGRRYFTALALVLMLLFTTACTSATATEPKALRSTPTLDRTSSYGELSRGNSVAGQDFGNWVVGASKGLIKDSFVRDNDKLGVVIASQVRPNEVKDLSKSLVQGFHKNFPNKDLTVLVYAPDKQLILTARYNDQTHQIEYQQAS